MQSASKLCQVIFAGANEVSDNQAALTARFGQDAVALLGAKTAELDKSNAMQSVNRAALPVATAEQRAAQVTLAASIAKLRYCAEIAFAGNKAVLKEFVALWSKKRRASEKASEPQPGSGGAPSTPADPAPAGSASANAAAAPTEAPAANAAAHVDAKPTT